MAKDYGDPYPSDIGDVAPINPTTGFAETNYKLNSQGIVQGAQPKMRRSPTQENPDLGHRDIQKPGRIVFTGIIVSKTPNRNAWIILRQDGKRGIAYIRGADGVYDNLRPGEHVSMCQGPLGSNQWLITGSPRRDELATISIYNSEEQGPSNTLIRVALDEIEKQTGEVGIFTKLAGGIKVNKHEWGLYEIHWKVTVVCVNPDEADVLTVARECLPLTGGPKTEVGADRIVVDRRAGLDLYSRVDGDENESTRNAIITIQVPPPYYSVQTPADVFENPAANTQDPPLWTNGVILGHSIEVGRQVPQGWVKIVSNGGGYAWLGHGNAKIKMRLPDTFPFVGSHLVVSGESGECVQTKWTNPGGNGYITIYCCYDDTLIGRWKVEDGLIISGPGIIPTSSQDGVPVTCNHVPRKIWSC